VLPSCTGARYSIFFGVLFADVAQGPGTARCWRPLARLAILANCEVSSVSNSAVFKLRDRRSSGLDERDVFLQGSRAMFAQLHILAGLDAE